MNDRRSAWIGPVLVAVGLAVLAHGAYSAATFEPSGKPCHFCAVAPGIAVPLFEVMLSPSVAAFGATIHGPRALGLPALSGRQRRVLRVGAALPVAGAGLWFLTGPYGIVLAAPVTLLGWLLAAAAVVAWGFDAGRELLERGR